MEAEILGFIAATLFAARGVIAAIQKEALALVTAAGGFIASLAIAIGDFKA